MHAQLSAKMKTHNLSTVQLEGRVEIRQGERVLSFDITEDKALRKALDKIEADRIRNLDDDLEPVLVARPKPAEITVSLLQPVPVQGAYENTGGAEAGIDYPVSKSVVKSKYRDKYKNNGDFSCGDEIADELKAFVHVLKGTRYVVDVVKLKEVAAANGVWEERYEKLNVGLRRMSIGNRLRTKYTNGERIDIGGAIWEKQFD